jgi:hypothetical protein
MDSSGGKEGVKGGEGLLLLERRKGGRKNVEKGKMGEMKGRGWNQRSEKCTLVNVYIVRTIAGVA